MNRPHISQAARRAGDQAISYLMKVGLENPDCISLAAGFVDESSLPTELVRDAASRLLTPDAAGRSMLQYGTTPGLPNLRTVFRSYLAELERNPKINDLPLDRFILTTGSQQLLSLVTQAVFDPGDICLVAAPTYFVYLSVLAGAGVEAIPVLSDGDGMQPGALDETLRQLDVEGRLDRVRMVYVVSYYDNPAGISVSADRRPQLLDIVRQWSSDEQSILLLEDAAYRELHFGGPVLPSIWSYDDDRRTVILTQTFSKTFSPGIRVGLSVLPEQLVKPVNDLKGNTDFGSPRFNQHLLADVVQSGAYAGHVGRVIDSYITKRDAMLQAADEYFSDLPGVTWEHPSGGLYVWMTLPDAVSTGFDGRLFHRATEMEKVIFVPGELFYPLSWAERPTNQMRLSYGVQSPDGIREGMRRLSAAVRHFIAKAA